MSVDKFDKNMINKKLLIIGGSKGIGLAIAKEAIKEYCQVIVLSRTYNEDLEKLNIQHIQQDFNNEALIDKTLCDIQPDIIIVSAANGLFFNDISTLKCNQIIDCLKGTFVSPILWISRAISIMSENTSICWISSLLTKLPNSDWAYYGASKAGVEHFINSIIPKARIKKINFTIVYPGCVDTNFHKDAGTILPKGAISADVISKDILLAIKKRELYWVANMDRSVILEFNEYCKHFYGKYRRNIK